MALRNVFWTTSPSNLKSQRSIYSNWVILQVFINDSYWKEMLQTLMNWSLGKNRCPAHKRWKMYFEAWAKPDQISGKEEWRKQLLLLTAVIWVACWLWEQCGQHEKLTCSSMPCIGSYWNKCSKQRCCMCKEVGRKPSIGLLGEVNSSDWVAPLRVLLALCQTQ